MSSNPDVKVKLPRPSLPPAAGMQRPYEDCAPAAPPARRESVSPTRAPMGWSMLLSVNRARRALEEEMRNQAAMASKTSEGEVSSTQVLQSTQVKVEVQDPPPRLATSRCRTEGLNDDQEVYRLEQQIASLRKHNVQLLMRLKDQEEAHLVRLKDQEEAHLVHLKGQEEAHLQTNSDLNIAIVNLETLLNAAEKLNKFQVEENNKLKTSNIHLSQTLEKSQTENKVSIQKWSDKVACLKSKIERQKKYSADLAHKLSKSARPAGNARELEEMVVWQRSRLRDQDIELSQVKSALAKEKRRSAQYPVESRRAIVDQKKPGCDMETQTHSSCLQMEPECSVVLQVVTKAFPTAATIMRNYEELSLSLSALRSPVKAAIAAMPPATRSWCLKHMMKALESEKTSEDIEQSSSSAQPQDTVSAEVVANDTSVQYGPKQSPPGAAHSLPPFALPRDLPPPPEAVPIDFSCRPRKRAAQDEATFGKQDVKKIVEDEGRWK